MRESLFGKTILKPSQVAARAQEAFDRHIGQIWVEGEISGLARPASGHLYFQLKDAKGLLKAVIWKGLAGRAGRAAQNGLSVLVRGSLSTYAPRGEYQLIVDYLEPRGEGALRLAFEKLKALLEKEGLFSPERKRPLPFWPTRVALVTSAGAAAAQDFLGASVRRCPSARISLYPVPVQGPGAALEIAQALRDLNQRGGFDLIVLTRGGGSLEDLWAFSEESLVRAVAASRIPVLAAIGHSTDLSLTELAADQRAITPTAAAGLAFPSLKEEGKRLRDLRRRLGHGAASLLSGARKSLETAWARLYRFQRRLMEESRRLYEISQELLKAMERRFSEARQRLGRLAQALRLLSPRAQIRRQAGELESLTARLGLSARRTLALAGQNLAQAVGRLSLVSPLGVLERGYSLATDTEGRVLRRASELEEGRLFRLRLQEGSISARSLGRLP
jgi:exodeoxyribonuclease VII large subunit